MKCEIALIANRSTHEANFDKIYKPLLREDRIVGKEQYSYYENNNNVIKLDNRIVEEDNRTLVNEQ